MLYGVGSATFPLHFAVAYLPYYCLSRVVDVTRVLSESAEAAAADTKADSTAKEENTEPESAKQDQEADASSKSEAPAPGKPRYL